MFGDALFQLAIVEYLAGNLETPRNLVESCLEIQCQSLDTSAQLLSEQSLMQSLGEEESRLDLLLSILLDVADHDPKEMEDAAKEGLAWTIQLKGLALDLSCRTRALQQSRLFDSEVNSKKDWFAGCRLQLPISLRAWIGPWFRAGITRRQCRE